MDTEHDTDIMTKEALEFGEWLSRVAVPALLRRRTRLSERRARAATLRDRMDTNRLKESSPARGGMTAGAEWCGRQAHYPPAPRELPAVVPPRALVPRGRGLYK